MKEKVFGSMNLYFIALVPHSELRGSIKAMKEEMKIRFGSGHALKSPAHITLQMPFKRDETEERQMTESLQLFASREKPFRIHLDGFGYFPKGVIFIKVTDHNPITTIHRRLNKILMEQLGFTGSEIMNEVHPHITLATRDLTPATLREAWPEYENREFNATFEARSLFLLKHNGKHWEIFREFLFSQNE